ncbi:hypothetical protein PV735_05320 [Streptomyces turgidiscabies]|nr:hypothetical protein [Streptomyces turgidiscabies]MDX3492109.1 hypothetical protein [Streptomyces turgidiscabies]
MTVQIKLIGQAEPVQWKDEKPARPSFREYSYWCLSSGALRIDVTVQNVDDEGHQSQYGTTTEIVYGPHAWEQVEGDGETGA